MLDMRSLVGQLNAMTEEIGRQADANGTRLTLALDLLASASRAPSRLLDRRAAYTELEDAPWPLAMSLEPLATRGPLPPGPATWSVMASDGSQIAPSHHEVALCYLLNVGRILYTYGTGEQPIQDARPFLYHREADMRPMVGGRQVGVNEELIAAYRQAKEASALLELAQTAVERGHPAIALVDGSLIQWPLEGQPEDFQAAMLGEHLEVYEGLRALGVPVAGYISQSRAAEVGNLLRLQACPLAALSCESCGRAAPPCGTHLPIGNRRLWEATLRSGERSPLFGSTAAILRRYGPHRVAFFYLHVGSEVARIEVPAWVAEAPAWLDRVHSLVYDQVGKGQGYPIALQEAHNQAVVGRDDRDRFFALLSRRMAEAGVRVAVSNKQLKKRMGAV